ncbi:response regulator (plasmid) [Paraburkholderia sp. D15]|uniref:response regulator n=1 Tax=Paraburkholderia sp. D15 TaxID=2880218 RepID=UPI0024790ADC|nr:response regulator [Paraburkholderia sp. D15]WGS54944.1 response regulator [Paraburkholderia sp. D15]
MRPPVLLPVHILVVDDYRDGAEAIATFLSLSGYGTQFVVSGAEVATAVALETPQIALLDINMPGMDGFAVARLLRQTPQTRDAVIIAFTAQDEGTIVKPAISAGFDAYCQKAQSLHRLLLLLNEVSN